MSSLKFVRYPVWFALSISFAIVTGMLVMLGDFVNTTAAFTTALIALGHLVIGMDALMRAAQARLSPVQA